MTNFDYNNGVPNANNNPSNDQPDMLTNTQNLELIWDEDHVGFNATNGGTHLQTSHGQFSTGTLVPATSGTENSTAYPAAGTAIATHPQYKFKNQLGTFILSPWRAMASVNGASGAILNQDGNVVSVTPAGGGYNVIIQTNIVSGTNYGILVTSTVAGGISPIPSYAITSATTFTLKFIFTNGTNSPTQFSFAVFQI